MKSDALFQPLQLGRHLLRHRVVMAPLTRMRAGPGTIPSALAAEYYGQRASRGGLMFTEATQIAPEGQGYPNTPGIHSSDQIAAWKKVTAAVHAKGGIIFMQLWHVGRSSHSSFQPNGVLPVAPSALAIGGTTFDAKWKKVPFETPRALELDEIGGIVEAYRQAARNAMEAGFDGVELHGANGYLIEQFLHSRSNRRTDPYGGSIDNRSRFLLEATEALVDVWGADRVGVRLSPNGMYNDVGDDNPIELYGHVLAGLEELDIAYLHLIEARDGAGMEIGDPRSAADLRGSWRKPLLLAGGFTQATAEQAVREGQAEAVAFGRLFIANPDLPARMESGAPLNPYNRATFYGGGAEGYVDYPAL